MERSILRRLPPELHLMVFRELSNNELEILIRTCKAMMSLAEAQLYRRDARELNPKALLWAIALSGCSGLRKVQGFQILDKLERYADCGRYDMGINTEYRQADGREVVASAYPLHFAAALGSVQITKRLLQHGALPKVWGFNVNKFISRTLRQCLSPPRRSELEDMDLTERQSSRCSISPLAYAFSRDYAAMIQLFLHAAHDFTLVDKLEDLSSPPRQWRHTATTLHRIAASKKLGKFMAAELDIYALHVNRTILDRAPLHLAVQSRNLQAFQTLLACDHADLDVQTYLGRTPLLVATHGCWVAFKKGHREQYRDMAIQLIDKGADVNVSVGGMVDETPLITMLKGVHGDCDDSLEDIWPLVEHLLRNGARLNDITPQGTSAMQLLFMDFLEATKPKQLGLKLKQLIEEFGGDVNIPFAPMTIPQITEVQGQIRNVSMLGLCCLWSLGQPKTMQFGKYLVEHGARFNDEEAGKVLTRWLRDEKFRGIKWLPMVACGQRLSEQLAFNAYRYVLHTTQDASLAQQLLKWLPWPKAANELIRDIAFSPGFEPSVRNLILKTKTTNRCEDIDMDGTTAIPFDATGLNLLHEIVNRLRHDLSYTEGAAAHEAELFIRRGATTLLNEDRERHFPKSSVDWLQQLADTRKGKLTKVLDVFRRARDREESRVMEDCSTFV